MDKCGMDLGPIWNICLCSVTKTSPMILCLNIVHHDNMRGWWAFAHCPVMLQEMLMQGSHYRVIGYIRGQPPERSRFKADLNRSTVQWSRSCRRSPARFSFDNPYQLRPVKFSTRSPSLPVIISWSNPCMLGPINLTSMTWSVMRVVFLKNVSQLPQQLLYFCSFWRVSLGTM